jgi:transcription termination factor Rho
MSSTTEVLVRDDQAGGGGKRSGAPDNRRPRPKPLPTEDEALVPITGIVDLVDNDRGFVRTSGYLPGPDDVYVSQAQVRRYGLRSGDLLAGATRPGANPKEKSGPKSRTATPLVRVDTVAGMAPEAARDRPDFAKLTPLYPQERLRLETEPAGVTTRIIDLVAPIGKGSARADRVPAEGRQDDGAAGTRQRDHPEQPRVPPDGLARRRAARRGDRNAALGQG